MRCACMKLLLRKLSKEAGFTFANQMVKRANT